MMTVTCAPPSPAGHVLGGTAGTPLPPTGSRGTEHRGGRWAALLREQVTRTSARLGLLAPRPQRVPHTVATGTWENVRTLGTRPSASLGPPALVRDREEDRKRGLWARQIASAPRRGRAGRADVCRLGRLRCWGSGGHSAVAWALVVPTISGRPLSPAFVPTFWGSSQPFLKPLRVQGHSLSPQSCPAHLSDIPIDSDEGQRGRDGATCLLFTPPPRPPLLAVRPIDSCPPNSTRQPRSTSKQTRRQEGAPATHRDRERSQTAEPEGWAPGTRLQDRGPAGRPGWTSRMNRTRTVLPKVKPVTPHHPRDDPGSVRLLSFHRRERRGSESDGVKNPSTAPGCSGSV